MTTAPPGRAPVPNPELANARARSILRGHWQNPPQGVMQYRLISQSELYVLYDLGPRKGWAVVAFRAAEFEHVGVHTDYLTALDDFCLSAGMPPIDSRQLMALPADTRIPTEATP